MKPHIVQGWMYHGNVAALVATTLSGRREATRVAWGIRSSDRATSDEAFQLRAMIWGGAHLSRFSDALIANSRAGLDYHAKRGYRSKQMLLIHNGIDATRFRPDAAARATVRQTLGIPSDAFVVAHVARVHPMKDHPLLLDVARRLPNVRFLAIGAGTDALAEVPNVRKLGRRADIPSLLAASDVILSTSAYGEGFSNAIGEGMAAGLVPVATDVGDAKDIIGDVGSVVPVRAAQALVDAIEAIARLPRSELAHQAAQSRARLMSKFSLDTSIGSFTSLYMRLAAGHAVEAA
jgi:glycosyltransferase involved in cell wall biosynthesis